MVARQGRAAVLFHPEQRRPVTAGDLAALAHLTQLRTLTIGSDQVTDAGGHGYNRPEDIEIIGNTLYVAVTEGVYEDGVQTFDGRVLAIDLWSLEVSNFIKPGINVPVEIGVPGDADFQTGFDNPDNLAETPDGKLVIVEDNVPSDIWVASKQRDRRDAASGERAGYSIGQV